MKLLYFPTEGWYFCSHRLLIARVARETGLEVVVATRVNAHADCITQEGFRLIPLKICRQKRNPMRKLETILEIVNIYHLERPDLVNHVAFKTRPLRSISGRDHRCTFRYKCACWFRACVFFRTTTSEDCKVIYTSVVEHLKNRSFCNIFCGTCRCFWRGWSAGLNKKIARR